LKQATRWTVAIKTGKDVVTLTRADNGAVGARSCVTWGPLIGVLYRGQNRVSGGGPCMGVYRAPQWAPLACERCGQGKRRLGERSGSLIRNVGRAQKLVLMRLSK
jgi:hypothetical protein